MGLKIITFKTSVFSGDLIYTLPGIKSACEKLNAKAGIYLWLDRKGVSYDGASHPYGDIMMNEYAMNMLKPLVELQDYVDFVKPWGGEEIIVDLDDLRTKNPATMMPYGSITRWAGYAWPDMQCDLSKAWMNTDGDFEGQESFNKIIINRTSRYQNQMIHYFFLREYKDQVIFAGLPQEHEAFCKEWSLEIPLLKVNNFLDLAKAMRACKYFIGNQSMCFAIAEAMKIPRLLEVCAYAPNVIPCGRDGYDFNHQFALEWFVKNVDSPLNKL